MDIAKLAVGIVVTIIMVVIAAEVLAGLFPTFTTSLTTLNNTANIPLRALISPDGVLPLLLIAGFFLAIVMGLVYLVKAPKR